ncbi:MAG: hypothetical protein JW891_17505 [Candidatus Lokiarchaeota archaeon]|nr:hypothetical protein [Candidatus Lokiarchaeota archaeon]
MSDKNTGLILIGILAIAGLGLGGYLIVKNEIISPPSRNTGSILVGSWDYFTRNIVQPSHNESDWLLQVLWTSYPNVNTYNDTRYLSFSNNNTRFTLVKEGYYKFNLNALLVDLIIGSSYHLYACKNGDVYKTLGYVIDPTTTGEWFSGSIIVYSDGNDYFEINGYHPSDSFGFFYSIADYQFSIEYMIM